jgi:hypothetical protein
MTKALLKTVVDFTSDENTQPQLGKAERDAEICRLWQAQWPATKISEHLDVTVSTVNNVVRKNGLVRKPRAKVVETVALADAPVEAWQQAVLPELEQAADAVGLNDAFRRALVILGLLRLKPYASLAEFEAWVRDVTEYDPQEIALFLERAKNGHIVDEHGQPDPRAYTVIEEPDNSDIAAAIMAGVLCGKFNRTADDIISAAPDQLQDPDSPNAEASHANDGTTSEPDEQPSNN